MKVKETPPEQLYVDHHNPEDLQHNIDIQHKVILQMKKTNLNQVYIILVIIDEFSDDPSCSRHSKLLHSLFTRAGIIAVQQYYQLKNILL